MNETKTMKPFFFDPNNLKELADKHNKDYVSNKPFPHIVIDNFLPQEVLNTVLEEFPTPTQIKWEKFDKPQEKKLATTQETQIGDFTRHLISQLNSSVFIMFLESLTGIDGLIPDPHLFGGGLHQIIKGGHLGVHADFNWHRKLQLDRRLNLLIYLNKDWKEEYGGYLQLWNTDMTKCEKKILPIFNRMVLFNTTSFSFHGHPDPLTCPEGSTRKSLALYYYTNGRPANEVSAEHSTLFQKRPGEKINTSTESIILKLTPPLFVDLIKKIKDKRQYKLEAAADQK